MKNCRKNVIKSRNGITLIALVITIIVLLILAGISISMLSGDNGILQKATDAKTNTGKTTVIELAQTDILGQITENKGETITETQLKTILNKYFEEINEDLPEDLSETTITLTAKAEYGGYTNIALVDIYNGTLKIEPLSIINYGGKTAETVEVGDDLTIETEKFMVIKVSADKKITAMPYYNITSTGTCLQNSSAGTMSFASSNYWNESNVDIDMTDSRNTIQKYILSYQDTLQNFGASNVTTRVPRYSDVSNLTTIQRNPGQIGEFWIGTSGSKSVQYVRKINSGGLIISTQTFSNHFGVRPLIEIAL